MISRVKVVSYKPNQQINNLKLIKNRSNDITAILNNNLTLDTS